MHYYQFNIADYRADTTHLTPIEHYIYRTLIDWYYLDEKPLPDIQTIIRRLGIGNDRSTTVQQVLNDFFVPCNETWKHERIEREIAEYRRLHEVASRAGKASAASRKAIKNNTLEHAFNDRSTTVQPTNNHKPITINQEQKEQHLSDKSDVPSNFAELWKAYPKKVGKAETLKAWKSLKINGEFPQIMEALERQKLSKKWQEGFILDPVRWVKGRRWEDVVEVDPDFTSLLSDQITPIDCGDSWKDSASGITVKGRSLGIEQQPGEPFPMFKIRVIEASQ